MDLLSNSRDGSDGKGDILGSVDVTRGRMPLEEIRLFLLKDRDTTVSVLHHQSSLQQFDP